MKKLRLILLSILPNWIRKNDTKTLRMKAYLRSIITTQAFERLSLPDKLTSLARLISIAERDYGFTPKEFERAIKTLSEKLNHDMARLWEKTYTEYFMNRKTR